MKAAGSNPNPEVIKVLLEAGADGTRKCYEGKTAFDYANYNDAISRDTDVYWMLSDARF